MLILTGLLLIVLLTALTGYFVAQEFAYLAVDRNQLRRAAAGGDAAGARALRVTERLSLMLSGAQLGITLTALLVGFVAEPYLGRGLADLLGLAGVEQTVSLSISVVVALAVATMVQMVLGELIPKNLAISTPDRLARVLSRSTLVYLAVAGPVIRLFDGAANWLVRRVGIEPVGEPPPGATTEELRHIVAESRVSGHLDAESAHLLGHSLDFRSRTADEVMVPRVDVVSVPSTAPATRVVELLNTGHSRFPVLGSGVDDVVGVVSLTDILDVPHDRRAATSVASITAPALMVPTSLALPAVLERLRSARRQLGCVIDEYGGLAGVITLEDIAEELVGQIWDEDDLPEDTVEPQRDGSWLVPARWRLDEIADATGITLPEHEIYDTLSGLVLRRLGRVPVAGDVVEVDPVPGSAAAESTPPRAARLTVVSVRRHVPHTIRVALVDWQPKAQQ